MLRILRGRQPADGGQGLTELALVLPFLLVLIGAVVDFGFAFFVGQIAQFAARDGARLGATLPPTDFDAPTFPAAELGSCTMLSGCSGNSSRILRTAAQRIPGVGLFEGFAITADESIVEGQEAVTVTVTGTYRWLLLHLIRAIPALPLLGNTRFPEQITISRTTTARWEWQ